MIFNERNDPNQISNLIDYQSGESKLDSSNSVLSEISEMGNESRMYDNSFDKPHYRSIDSQISEYAVQKSIIEYPEFKSGNNEYESQNSVLNNLQFTSKNREEEYSSNKKDGYINFLWRRGNGNNRDSQKILTSKKHLLKELNQFNETEENNKINLSSMLSNNSAVNNPNTN